jgi:hypothetical protein
MVLSVEDMPAVNKRGHDYGLLLVLFAFSQRQTYLLVKWFR